MTTRFKIAYDYLMQKAPCLIHYHVGDSDAMVILMNSGNVYGLGQCDFFNTMENLKNNKEVNFSGQILTMFSGEISKFSHESVDCFASMYYEEVLCADEKIKDEMMENYQTLLQEIDEMFAHIKAKKKNKTKI